MVSESKQDNNEKSLTIHTQKPKIAGLIIIGFGILGLVGIVLTIVSLLSAKNVQDLGFGVAMLFLSIFLFVYAIINILGGISILKRKGWERAIFITIFNLLAFIVVLWLIGSFSIVFTFGIIGVILGITCISLVISSKSEFE